MLLDKPRGSFSVMKVSDAPEGKRSSAFPTRIGRSQTGVSRRSISGESITPVTFSPVDALYSLDAPREESLMSRSVGLRVLAGCALAALLCAARPAAGLAQTPSAEPAEYHFSTSIATAYGSQYPITGHLDLQIYPNGILRGYYHNAYQKEYI